MDNMTFNQRYNLETLKKKRALLNDDGSVTTVKSIGIEHNDKQYVIPSYDNDSGTILSPKAAKKKFMSAILSGQVQAHDTIAEANAFADEEHKQIESVKPPENYIGFGPMRSITSLQSILGNR